MTARRLARPFHLVLLGGNGDLAWRKLGPALFHLHVGGWLPRHFAVAGLGRGDLDDGGFRDRLRNGVERFAGLPDAARDQWGDFARRLSWIQGDVLAGDTFTTLRAHLEGVESAWPEPADRIYYLAVPPQLFEPIIAHLLAGGLCRDGRRERVVIEKPFGHDLASARALDARIAADLDESQIFRIDHFLGKETVQNILALRFGNGLFEPIWNRQYIDHVQVTMAESVGVEHRGGYYEGTGALRDMLQNHLLQVLSLIAMEAPVSLAADEIRSKKVDVLRAARPLAPDDAVRGQYGAGSLDGARVPGYRQERGIGPRSTTETYAAVKLHVDNWRWFGVPFYLRTGKRLRGKASEVVVVFRPAPHRVFPPAAATDWPPNRLTLDIQPDEGVRLSFMAKQPGLEMLLSQVEMRFAYADGFPQRQAEAYETLLLDVFEGDATLFKRGDQVELAWRLVTPILEHWETTSPRGFPDYAAGTWGPAAADELLSRDGRAWIAPTYASPDRDAATG